jgi:hypothetical protein
MNIPETPGVSWWHVVTDLSKRGYTSAQVAAVVGCGGSTVRDWKNLNAEPGHVDGERLIHLWRVVMGKSREDLPLKASHILSAASFK